MLTCAKRYQVGKIGSETAQPPSPSSAAPPLSPSGGPERLTQRDFVTSRASVASTSSPASPQKQSPVGASSNTDPDPHEPLLPDVMRAHIPSYCAAKVETLVKRILEDALTTDEHEWTPLSHKKDIRAHAKTNGPSGAAFYIKGETFLPYSIPEIFSVYFDPTNRPVLDSQMATYSRLRWVTRHVGYEYMQFKGQWPTTARDSCNLTVRA